MKATLEKHFPALKVELIKSGGGVFEVADNGTEIFSKKATGRFPSDEEIIDALKQRT